MILAAGRGLRMMPLTAHTPKPLLAVMGKPLLQYHLEALIAAGVSEIVVNGAYLADQVKAFLVSQDWGGAVHFSQEHEALETAGGIIQALPLLGEKPFVLVNGDVFTDYAYSDLSSHDLQEDLAHLVLVPNPPHHLQGDFYLQQGRVFQAGGALATFSGLSVLSPQLFAKAKPGVFKLAPFLRQAMQAGRVSGELYTGLWSDIGTPQRLAALEEALSPAS